MAHKSLLMVLILAGAVSISGCGESENAGVATGNFVAEISGTVSGRVSGPGIIRFLPASAGNFSAHPTYFFIADDSGVRELGITFTIPANTRPGKYQLVSGHPMDVGKHFEVRVDRSVGDRTESFGFNTKGTLTIEAIPVDGVHVAGERVTGRFDFSTQDRSGKEVKGQGTFDFEGS